MLRRHILTALLFLSFNGVLRAADDRIHTRLDPNRVVSVKGHLHPAAVRQNDQGAADAALPMDYVTILMKPGAGLEQFLAEQQSPGSPNYHRWLTPEQYGERFGLSGNDMSQVVGWLKSQGLRVHDVARGRHWVTFSGTAGQIGKAFHTEIHRYQVNGEMRFANAIEPSVPEAFQSVVAGFDRLNDFKERPYHVRGAEVPVDLPAFNSGSSHYLAPDDVATIYNLSPLYAAGIDGAGQKIAVIGRTNIELNEIRTFRRRFNLPVNDPQVVLFGPDPGISSGDVPEAHLDIEWSGAAARNATIIYVNSLSVRTSAQYAIDQNLAPVMTYSYGSCEQTNSPVLRQLAQQAVAQGITWMVSSGDAGSTSCDTSSFTPQSAKGPTVSWPASAPEITAVGGTTLNEGAGRYWASSNDVNGASALSYIPEKVWNDNGATSGFAGSAGGGASAFFSKPFWQIGPGVPNENARYVPDVSLAASANHDGYLVQTNGNLYVYGGTSVGTPIFAGVVALLNQFLVSQRILTQPGAGNINPALYRMAQSTPAAFHDVVDGDNKVPCVQSSPGCIDGVVGFAAGPGYDLASGLGSIDAYQLVTKWDNGNPSRITVTANPSAVNLNGTVELTAAVAGDRTPTGSVTFLVNDTQLGVAQLKTVGDVTSATLTVNAVLVLGGTGVVSALYSGNAYFAASAGSVTVTPNLPASGSLVVPSITPNPVYQASATSWPYTLTLSEKNGVATKVTAFTVNGVNNLSLLGSGNIAAKETLSFSLSGNNLTNVPLDRTFVFTGVDADGRQWTQQIVAPFVGPAGPLLFPSMIMTSTPKLVQQNPRIDPSCQWAQQITLQEQNGYLILLAQLTAGTDNFTSQIQQIFGTTRLAPYGTLQGTLCWGNLTPPLTKTIQIIGVAETGATVTSSISVQYQAAAATAAPLAVSASKVALSLADSKGTASSTVNLSFGDTPLPWTASILPGNGTTTWLKVTPASGTGPGSLTVQAVGTGLSNGVYQAVIAVESPGSVPEAINIPVTLVVGGSTKTTIGGVANGASFETVFAPGMLASVFGTELSPITQKSNSLPLPFKVSGVSATVNGISAPLFYISPGQLNIQIPYEAGSGPAMLAVNNNGQIASFPLTIAVTAPGLFGMWDVRGVPAASAQQGQALVAFITGEGDETPILPTGASVPSGTPVSRLPVPRLPVVVTVGGIRATVAFAGIPIAVAGVTQINFTVPLTAPLGPQPVVVTVGGVAAPAVMLNVTAQAGQ